MCFQMMSSTVRFKSHAYSLHSSARAAIHWQAERSAEDVMAERDTILAKMEKEAESMWWVNWRRFEHLMLHFVQLVRTSGECASWYAQAAPHIKQVSKTVCGPMLELLSTAIEHPDGDCCDLFRHGTTCVSHSLHA